MQAHILYLSRIEIPSLVGNFELKVGNFELKSYPKSWEVWPPIFVFDQSPHPIPWKISSMIFVGISLRAYDL